MRTVNPNLPFRQKVLQLKYFELRPGDQVWVHIRPDFEKMYQSGHRMFEGVVVKIPGQETENLHVRTEIGFWFFTPDGLSLTKQATLSVRSSRPGELLCLYEPEPVAAS